MSEESSPYRGVVVPMVSPFTTSGKIDEPAVKRIVDLLVGGGSAGVFPLGTTGESVSISLAEKRKLVATTVKATAGRAMVYAGISSNCFAESVDAAAAYKELGVDAVVAHAPSYFPLTDRQIEAYFERLADASPLPLVLYNIPVTTHLTIPIDAVMRLAEHPNVVALKDSANDPARLTALLDRTGGRGGFPVLLGSSAAFTHGLKHGGVGLVPSGSHLVPSEYNQMYVAAMDDDWARVEQLQQSTDAVCATYIKGRTLGESLARLKALLAKKGVCGKTMLPPLTDDEEIV